MGTANLIGKHLELAWHDEDPADEIATAIAKYDVVQFDAGSANGHLFLLMASCWFRRRRRPRDGQDALSARSISSAMPSPPC